MRPFYRFVKTIVFVFFKLFYRISASGLENLPEAGGYIIAPNHASLLDPPAVGCVLPHEVSFFAKKELMPVPLLGFLMRYTRTIPVDRKRFSPGSLKEMVRTLKRGRPVIIFPEGTRTRTGRFLPPKKGVGMVAVMAGVPVVPCLITGTFRAKPFVSRIGIHFLPAFRPEEIETPVKKAHYLLVSERIMCDIKRLHEKINGRSIDGAKSS